MTHTHDRTRLRYADLEKQTFPDGRTVVEVTLEWVDRQVYRGTAEGIQTRQGEIRAAAVATLQAAQEATIDRLTLELLGAKAIRIFDSWVVIVYARGSSDAEEYSLVGAYPCPDERTDRGAALAALNAINRILEGYVE